MHQRTQATTPVLRSSVTFPVELMKRAKHLAVEHNETLTAILVRALQREVDRMSACSRSDATETSR